MFIFEKKNVYNIFNWHQHFEKYKIIKSQEKKNPKVLNKKLYSCVNYREKKFTEKQ